MGTELFDRTVAYDYGDAERNALMIKVWTPTPWMLDAFTGRLSDDRSREMCDWCREKFGDECLPIHGRPGNWQRGGVTIHGWTWFGFATEAMLQQFDAAWPHPDTRGGEGAPKL